MRSLIRHAIPLLALIAPLAVASTADAAAAAATCEGRPATIIARAGQPTNGTSGDDVIVGTSGADVIDGRGGDDIICGRDGRDRITGGLGDDTINGGKGGDVLWGESGADVLLGGDGPDRAYGGDGADEIRGGSHGDKLIGGDGSDTINGGPGRDELKGAGADDQLQGGDGADYVSGGEGGDVIGGGAGNDSLYGGSGSDRCNGGGGSDFGHGSCEQKESANAVEMPAKHSTGPRKPITRTLTAEQAMQELRRTGYLSQVRILGQLTLEGRDGIDWVIEDSIIEAGQYGIDAYSSSSLDDFEGTRSQRPIIRRVTIEGRAERMRTNYGGHTLAGVRASHIVLQRVRIFGSEDGVKINGDDVTISRSWIHDLDHPVGAHCDGLHIRAGSRVVIEHTRVDSYVGYSHDGSTTPGVTCNGATQFGPIYRSNPPKITFTANWFAGEHFTVRGITDRDQGAGATLTFRRNLWRQHGESVELGRTNLPPNRWGPTMADLKDADSSNVWEHTGRPVA